MKIPFALFLALGTSASASAQINHDDLTPLELSYTTTVSEDMKSFQIELEIDHVKRPSLHVSMPNWTPGAYGIGNYGDNVRDLKVVGSGEVELSVTRMNHGSWSIATEGHRHLTVSYELPASSRRRFFGRARQEDSDAPITGLRIRGPGTYLYVRGAKSLTVTSRYVIPEGWRIANGLLSTDDPMVRYARDYDTFIDAPTILGVFQEREFQVNGIPFACVFFENAQEYDFDIEAFVAIVEKIVTNIGELYGGFPFPNYVFLFTLPGGGGLEHLNSTSIGLNARSQREDPEAGASVTAHEFFHAWNVKRIRPEALGPFDYQRENYTGNLWVSEGWTSYFGELTLARTGLLDRDEYLNHLERIIRREQNKERRKDHSVYWASRNTWHRYNNEEGSRVDIYGKGELLGALIDLKIRHETGNKKSLNDVMRFFNRWFAQRGVGFEEMDVERACTAISNYDFGEFFARHILGTVDPPIAEYLAYAGIDYSEETIECSFPFPLRGKRVSGRPGGARRTRNRGPEAQEEVEEEPAGPRPGEVILSIDGVEFEDANTFLRGHAAGDVVKLTLERRDEQREVEVTLGDKPIMIPKLGFREGATEGELLIRESWLSSVK